MEKSIIREMLAGLRETCVEFKYANEDYELFSAVSDTYDDLKEQLSTAQAGALRDLIDAVKKTFRECADLYYVRGFKIGLLTGMECARD